MYRLDIYRFPTSIEREYKFKGNYGAKGEKRQKKQKRTPEDIERQNQYQRTKTVRHLIKANFTEGDYWTTLTYPKETAGNIQSVVSDIRRFLSNLRRSYKKVDIPCKYICRVEIGSRGGIHVHIILNRIQDLDRLIQKYWIHGKAHTELLDDGTYEQLADYIVKPPTDQQKKLLKTFEEDARKLIRYSCSRNLIRPVPETKEMTRRTMREVFNNDIVPEDGYYIDKNSIRRGINPYTGMSYLYYQEVKLRSKQQAEPVRLCECQICHQLTLDFVQCDCQLKRRKRVSSKYLRKGKYKSSTKA